MAHYHCQHESDVEKAHSLLQKNTHCNGGLYLHCSMDTIGKPWEGSMVLAKICVTRNAPPDYVVVVVVVLEEDGFRLEN